MLFVLHAHARSLRDKALVVNAITVPGCYKKENAFGIKCFWVWLKFATGW
jgi:hypothetical protein